MMCEVGGAVRCWVLFLLWSLLMRADCCAQNHFGESSWLKSGLLNTPTWQRVGPARDGKEAVHFVGAMADGHTKAKTQENSLAWYRKLRQCHRSEAANAEEGRDGTVQEAEGKRYRFCGDERLRCTERTYMGSTEHIALKEEQQSDADDKNLAIEWEYGEGGGAVGNVLRVL